MKSQLNLRIEINAAAVDRKELSALLQEIASQINNTSTYNGVPGPQHFAGQSLTTKRKYTWRLRERKAKLPPGAVTA